MRYSNHPTAVGDGDVRAITGGVGVRNERRRVGADSFKCAMAGDARNERRRVRAEDLVKISSSSELATSMRKSDMLSHLFGCHLVTFPGSSAMARYNLICFVCFSLYSWTMAAASFLAFVFL